MSEDSKEVQKSKAAKREEEVLSYWKDNDIFQKTLKKESPKGEFIFYDGPPFANGLPHYGHILATTIKDVVPRYKTMRGFHVPRRWGWDCHGLPVENLVEKELNLKTKKDIEEYGIDKFNAAARESVLRYTREWKEIIPRMGRFVDMDNDYRTMDPAYTESVWWAFKRLYESNLIYEGFKAMQLCPRCETTLSNFEVSQGYKEVTDISVYVQFELEDEQGTYLLAWTTTPWTLPGNAALAIAPDSTYVKIKIGDSKYIVAKERLSAVKEQYETLNGIQSYELVGKKYRPVFDYYVNDASIKHKENGWKVYTGDFVTMTEGTGIVHIAPAFGEDDMNLGKTSSLPFIQHVATNGTFKKEVRDFAGRHVKPKEKPEETDIEIIKYLAHKNLLFAKEKITHPYPHCWRCDTPLINFAASSWFVKVPNIKDDLIKENENVRFVPKEIGANRFGKWLEGAREWAISRSRFWGAPIPVWKCTHCAKMDVMGSIEDITKRTDRRNRYFLMRHGEGEHNLTNTVSSEVGNTHHLTEKGRVDVQTSAEALKGKGIQKVYASDFLRTKETAEIVAKTLGLPLSDIIYDRRLREIDAGAFEGKQWSEYHAFFSSYSERFVKAPPRGETLRDVQMRTGAFLESVDRAHEKTTFLIIGHDDPLFYMHAGALGLTEKEIIALPFANGDFLKTSECKELRYARLPHNERFEVDLHRPYIDVVEFTCSCGGTFKRVPEVFDCWFESGSMPYAEAHYPWNKKGDFNPEGGLFKKIKGFPADFIAEGLDQTRGWFYSLLVLSVALFGKSPYKNVVVNGTLLAQDGEKLSKRLHNYTDPMKIVDMYGADALRFYLLSSPVVHGEDLRFSEKGVDDVSKKLLLRLDNVLSFYEMYATEDREVKKEFTHILDRWIMARLSRLSLEVTEGLENLLLDRATRPLLDFIDDLSTWYLRRSRERFKGDDPQDKREALTALGTVLTEFSKICAPFIPFYSEYLYGRVAPNKKESVHLEEWREPRALSRSEIDVLETMEEVRRVVSLALEARAKVGIKVRQPLLSLKIKSRKKKISSDFLPLIKDEVNVKGVEILPSLPSDIILDTTMTAELIEEGVLRDIIRSIQELRKDMQMTIGDKVTLLVGGEEAGKEFLRTHEAVIKKGADVKDIVFEDSALPPQTFGSFTVVLRLQR